MKRNIVQFLILIGCCLGMFIMQVQAASLVYIGTRGTWAHGVQDGIKEGMPDNPKLQGIYAAEFDAKTGKLTSLGVQAILEAASWLEVHPTLPVLYAVASNIDGRNAQTDVIAYSIDKNFGKLYLLNAQKTGGLDGTHMDIDPASNTLFIANYGSGDVAALPIFPDGSLGPVSSVVRDYIGPGGRRPSSHGVAIDPTGSYVLDACSWCYRIFVYEFDGSARKLIPAETPFVQMEDKVDPRHFVFHPGGKFVYTVAGFSDDILAHRFDPKTGELEKIQSLKIYPTDWDKRKSLAEIDISKDGRFLYTSAREGMDILVVYAINQENGMLKEIQRISATGKNPWSFRIDPSGKWMLVTNTDTETVDVFKVDPASGKLEATKESISVPQPQIAVFVN